ncbi:MAG TPA: prolyl oligopeptidase family serine peptidase, partial [Pseudogracilibacillus sp.]|nr:prolyl oligopeptidase family serine peptidase [Pseudogracilibacillus sp.]
LSHGAAYDADSWEDQGEQFAENNVTAFAVEDTNDEELVDAAEWLKEEQGVEKVAVLGASAGGASAIEAVEKDDTVFDKVALLSPGSDATSIKDTPVLVVYSEEEGFEDLEENQPENLETLAISGDAHAQEMFQDDEKSTEVMKKITAFLEE